MKTEISRDSHQPNKRYSGVYQQQGRMLTDADWNELVEILKGRLNESLKDVVGSNEGGIGGTPRHRALKIVDDGGIKIHPGHVYVNGVAAQLPGDTDIVYDAQLDFPSPPTLPNNYVLYADVWERTVTHLMDEHLRDKGLHGADTCTRKQAMVQVKGCPNTVDPEQPEQNPAKGDAELTVTLLAKTTQPDPCDPCVSELDVESKIGNYLFRVEVHDVKGDASNPSEITMKWSSENAAEQFKASATKEEMPVGYVDNKYVYELFNETSEKHLGVHLVTDTAFPVRDILRKDYPATVPAGFDFVRRWDGYATFRWNTTNLEWGLHEDDGVSEGFKITEDSSSTKADKVLKLDSVELKQQLLNRIVSEPVTSDSLVAASLTINLVDIGNANSSAKEKAVAINNASASVTAMANTMLEGSAPSEKGKIEAGQLKINGEDIVLASVPDNVNSQVDALVNAINTNFLSDADFAASKSPAGAIVLTATDARNIVVEVTNDDVSKRCGFEIGSKPYYGRITIFSPLNSAITIAGDNPEYAGFVAGTTPAVQFVAGDYWLAEVREAEHKAGSVLIENKAPQGIEHHYLTLGEVDVDGLQANPEVDRKFAFPPLTEMTRMFHVGGDGQEAMPGHFVSQSLKVGVTNGEWPVAGVKIEFTVTKGSGELEAHPDFPLVNFDALNPITGIATTDGGDRHGRVHCRWKLGPGGATAEDRKQRVTIRLVEHDSNPGDVDYPRYHDHPPIHFYANLSTADQVAYVNPVCADAVSVNSLLQKDSDDNAEFPWPDLDGDGDVTVKDVLDALLCKLKAKHVPYNPLIKEDRWKDVNEEEEPDVSLRLPSTVQDAIDNLVDNLQSEDIIYTPNCTAEILPTVRSELGIPDDTSSRVHEVLDKLLCDFNATHLPIDKTDEELCARLKVNEVETVQDALDTLCREGDVKWHNKHLHGWGVVCGLKVKCHGEREKVEVEPGYALDCNGLGLHLIQEDDTRVFDLVANAEEQGLLDGDGNGDVCLWIDHNPVGQVQINIEEHTPQDFFDTVIEGSLIKDFFDDCILSLITFIMGQFPGSLDDDLPLTEAHHRATALINLLAQSINSASGQYVFLSVEEDRLLRDFYDALKAFIASETFCAMFDNDTPFPDYTLDKGLDTIFGPPLKIHSRLRLHPSGKFAYSYGLNNKIYVYDLTAREFAQTLVFPGSDNIDIKDIAFAPDGSKLYAVALLDDGNTVFATATIQADNSHTWSATTTINGVELVSLAVSPAFRKNLYAIGKSQGLFIIDTTVVPLTLGAADVPFNATGLLTLSTDGTRAFAALNQSIETETSTMTHVRNIDLSTVNGREVLYAIDGEDGANDIAFHGNIVYLTGHTDVNPGERVLVGYDITSGNPAFRQVPLEDAAITRLEVLGAAASDFGTHRIDATGTGLRAVEVAAAGIPVSRVAFTATTIAGSRGSAAITYAAADSARTIARVINAEQASTGVSADAVTRARLSALSAAGTVAFDLAAEGGTTRNISAKITDTADLQDLAAAINAQSATTNVSAVNNGSTLDLFNQNGDDITIGNFEMGAAGGGKTFTVTALNFDGTATAAETTNLAANAANATRITGQVRLDSSRAFSISGGDATVLSAGGSTFTLVDTGRIGAAAGREEYLLVALPDKYKLMRFDLGTNTLDSDFRIPAQHYPIDIAIGSNSSEAYALNMVSNTLTEINVAVVFDSGAPPNYTEEPPTISNVLSIYNQDAYDAYSDLVSHLLDYIKDCFCDKFLIDCPVCTGEEKIYLGAAEIRKGEVYNICNFTKRHYVKSFPTWGYWLSTIPILPLLKRSFASFCCSTPNIQR
jgi:hypothetical protein